MSSLQAVRGCGRAVAVLLAVFLTVGLAACGSTERKPLGGSELSDLLQRESGDTGEVAEQPIQVQRPNGDFVWTAVFIVRRPDGSRVVIDETGQQYEPSLDDFRANNTLFSEDDKISVPRDFPNATPSGEDVQLITVSGRTSPSWIWWLAGGGVTVVVLTGVGFVRFRRRRQPAPESGA